MVATGGSTVVVFISHLEIKDLPDPFAFFPDTKGTDRSVPAMGLSVSWKQ